MGLSSSKNYILDLSDSDDPSDISEYFLEENKMKETTDAASFPNKKEIPESNTAVPEPKTVLDLEKLSSIESSLDNYEVVSLVYLLYKNPYQAFQLLTSWLNYPFNKKPLYEWASNYNDSDGITWQDKMLEALCIIQNYKVLKQLGFEKHELICRYLPHLKMSENISKFRQNLYFICEQMDKNTTNQFLKKIKPLTLDIPHMKEHYLELYFLYLEAKKIPVSEIKAILKIMDLEPLYEVIDQIDTKMGINPQKFDSCKSKELSGRVEKKPMKKRTISTSVDQHDRDDVPTTLTTFPNIGDESNIHDNDETNTYDVDPEHPGVVLIINQEEFYTEHEDDFKHLLPQNLHNFKLDSRLGTSKDRDKLEEVFKKFKFNVIIKNNLIHSDILEQIKKVVQQVKNESSLFVCILSHGDKGIIYGVNSCQVDVGNIQDIMCKTNKHLIGKPKFLILQSCQGNECQKIDENRYVESDDRDNTTDNSKQAVPNMADMLTFWATVAGYAAIRNKRRGSWFIQTLCEKIEEFGTKYHFLEICTRIIKDITNKKWTQGSEQNVMTPMIASTLRKNFYLPAARTNKTINEAP